MRNIIKENKLDGLTNSEPISRSYFSLTASGIASSNNCTSPNKFKYNLQSVSILIYFLFDAMDLGAAVVAVDKRDFDNLPVYSSLSPEEHCYNKTVAVEYYDLHNLD